jgi:PAS domain S-box-containing protein
MAFSGGRDVILRGADRDRDVRISAAPLIIDDEQLHCLIVTDLSRQQLRLRHEALVRSAIDAIYSLDKDLKVETWNSGAEQLYLYTAAEAIGRPLKSLIVPDDRLEEYDELMRRMSAGKSVRVETVRINKNRQRIDVSLSSAPTLAEDGGLSGVAVIARDITERKRAEQHAALLLKEVNHRAKNLLAVVQAVALQTAATSEPQRFAEDFSKRLSGLAASHDLLVQSAWRGVELGDLIRSQLSHFAGLIGTRINLTGPQLQITPSAAQAIGMAIHELATNAGKHGALSTATGMVDVSWRLDGKKNCRATCPAMGRKERPAMRPAQPSRLRPNGTRQTDRTCPRCRSVPYLSRLGARLAGYRCR